MLGAGGRQVERRGRKAAVVVDEGPGERPVAGLPARPPARAPIALQCHSNFTKRRPKPAADRALAPYAGLHCFSWLAALAGGLHKVGTGRIPAREPDACLLTANNIDPFISSRLGRNDVVAAHPQGLPTSKCCLSMSTTYCVDPSMPASRAYIGRRPFGDRTC